MNRIAIGMLLAGFVVSSDSRAAAQSAGQGFLFGPPHGALAVRGGLDRPAADSDVFKFVIDQLTLDRGDFLALTAGGDIAIAVTPRTSVLFGASVSRTASPSEFRDWLDNRDLPITQTTQLLRVPLTASVKVYVTSPGRRISRFAWIPSRAAIYVGGGSGVMVYRFQQKGDFIDFDTLRVFYDTFQSSGVTPMAQAFAGIDVSLTPRLVLTTEAKYQRAHARLDTDFAGFAPIDLSGVSTTFGVAFRY